MLPNLYLISLDGSDKQLIDTGSWSALSPDGRQLAYAHNGLQMLDLTTRQTRTLIQEDSSYAMAWSPDGTQLAFVRRAGRIPHPSGRFWCATVTWQQPRYDRYRRLAAGR